MDNDSIYQIQHECAQDSEEWFPETAHDVPLQLICLAGEVGEVCNIIKKQIRTNAGYDSEVHMAIAMELTDVFIYLCNLANQFNVHLGEAYAVKRRFNAERFGRADHAADRGIQSVVHEPDAEGS